MTANKEITPEEWIDLQDEFWGWVVSRRARDNTRGDFIRDTRDLLRIGKDPGARITIGCQEARDEFHGMRKKFLKINGYKFPQWLK